MRQQIIRRDLDDYMSKRNTPAKTRFKTKKKEPKQYSKNILQGTQAGAVTIVAPEPNPIMVLYHRIISFFRGVKK